MDSLPLYLQVPNLIVYTVSLIIGIFFARYFFRFLKKQQEQFKQLASSLGLVFSFKGGEIKGLHGSWYMEGSYSSVKVDIRPYVEYVHSGSRSSRRVYYMQFSAYFPTSLNLGLTISEESFLSGLGKVIMGQDVQIGNPEFDKQFLIKSTSEAATKSLLSSPSVQDAVKRVFSLSKRASIDDEKVLVQIRGMSPDQAFFVKTLTELVSVVRQFR